MSSSRPLLRVLIVKPISRFLSTRNAHLRTASLEQRDYEGRQPDHHRKGLLDPPLEPNISARSARPPSLSLPPPCRSLLSDDVVQASSPLCSLPLLSSLFLPIRARIARACSTAPRVARGAGVPTACVVRVARGVRVVRAWACRRGGSRRRGRRGGRR